MKNYQTPLILMFLAFLIHVFFFPIDQYLQNVSKDVKGKRVLVTGSSKGIGKALALEFGKMGASQITIVSRSKTRLEQVKQEINELYPQSIVHIIEKNLSSEKECADLVSYSLKLMGGLDFLVLNHVSYQNHATWQSSVGKGADSMIGAFQVNTFSYFWITAAAMDALQLAKGRIAVISSLLGHIGGPYSSVYTANKHALHGFFNSVRNELRLQGGEAVSITLCAIGATDTEGVQETKKRLPLVTFDPPEKAALAVIQGMVSRKRDIFHPHHKVFPLVFLNYFSPTLVDFILGSVMVAPESKMA